MSWECPECGETNGDDAMAVCVCGFNRDEPVDDVAVSAETQISPVHEVPGHSRRTLWKIFKFVFVVHFVAWSVVMAKQTAGRPYVLARAVMTNAVVLTAFYIRPLRKILGPKNPLLIPLVACRDVIFDVAWDMFPADDADRTFYWYMIYGNKIILLDSIHSYSTDKRKNLYTDQEYEDYFSAMNSHMADLALLPMKDKKNLAMRYGYYGVSAKLYSVMYGIYLRKKHRVDYYLEPGSTYMKNSRKQFKLFLQLREKTKVDAPKTYEAFITREDDWWYPMQRYIFGVTNKLIYEDILQKSFDCSSPTVINFLESRKEILLYAPGDHRPEIARHVKSYLSRAIYNTLEFGNGSTFKIIKNKCNTPEIQAFE
jgi:hypothetical protein